MLKLMTARLLFYGGLLLLMPHAKHIRAETPNPLTLTLNQIYAYKI